MSLARIGQQLRLVAAVVPLLTLVMCSHPRKKGVEHLPPLSVDPFAGLDPLGDDEPQAYSFRRGPEPPPSTKRKIALSFPPAGADSGARSKPPSKRARGPLKVVRSSPEGKAGKVGAVTVTFNQPMVPVASLAELARARVPLEISPRPEGRFRWLGTQTVAFEPEGRMPFSTEYEVTIPAGTRSATGAKLGRAVHFSFSTPRPKLIRALPTRYSRQARPDTPIALSFNQRIDKQEVLAKLKLAASGSGSIPVALVPHSRWEKLRDIGRAVAEWDPDRTVVVRPKRPLPHGAYVSVIVDRGLSGEGPLRTTTLLSHGFRTYGPLRVSAIRCTSSYNKRNPCDPERGFFVRFSNPVVTEDLARYIDVSPRPDDLQVSLHTSWAYVRGKLAARTRYTVTVKPGIADIHDQKLANAERRALTTTDLAPQLRLPVRGLAAVERSGRRGVELEVVNVRRARLRMVRVTPSNLFRLSRLASYVRDSRGHDPLEGIGPIAVRRQLSTGVPKNGRGKTFISTDGALGKKGAGPAYIELRAPVLRRYNRWANRYRSILVQVTDLGIMARYGNDRIAALITGLDSGKPLGGVAVTLHDRGGAVVWRGKSDKRGMVRAPGRRQLEGRGPFALWAKRGRDRAFVILDQNGDDGGYLASYGYSIAPPKKRLALVLFSDRSPYRPGETVHLKGVLRVRDTTPTGTIEPLPPDTNRVRYRVTSARGFEVKKGELALSKSGAFSLDVKLSKTADLGTYRVRITPIAGPYGRSTRGRFEVQAYRAPEFKVTVETADEPRIFGDTLKARVGADYLFGAPMAGARCSWTLTRRETRFSPPGNARFAFGEPLPFRPGWGLSRTRRFRRGRRYGHVWRQRTGRGEIVASGNGVLGRDGRLSVKTKLERDGEAERFGPASFTLETQVVDENRQALAGRQTITAHPADAYVGLRAKRGVVRAGQSVEVEAVLAGLDGERIANKPITVRALQVKTRVKTVFEDGRWRYRYHSEEKSVSRCTLKSGETAADCRLKLPDPGSYKLRGEATDSRGRRTRTTIRVYAFGPGYVRWNVKNQSHIRLVADKPSYRPGETAKVFVRSPLRRGLGLLSIQRGGIERVERLEMKGNAQVIEVPIKGHHLPEVYVSVALARGRLHDAKLGKGARDLGRPTFAHGVVRLPVELEQKRIAVEVAPQKKVVGPSQPLKVKLHAKDHRARPVAGAELAVMVVDEGVLSLLGYQTPDPLAVFYASRSPGAPLADLRNALLAQKKRIRRRRAKVPKVRVGSARNGHRSKRHPRRRMQLQSATLGLTGHGAGGGSGAGYGRGAGALGGMRLAQEKKRIDGLAAAPPAQPVADAEAAQPGEPRRIRSRSHFATTAYFNPSVVTGRDGSATITVKMPDNLTTYRIMAVALDRGRADRFGRGEAQVKVRKTLLLRPSLPRFLSVGDRFEAAVMVHNETANKSTVDVLVRGRNAVAAAKRRKRVAIGAHGAKEVRFSMKVQHAGPARVQFAAVLGDQTDAVEKQLPVLLPVTTEAFATYGVTEDSVAQPVSVPDDALAGYGGLEVSMASTALNGLEDAVRYLVSYPHECTEQTASRVLPIFSLGEILGDFGIGKLADQKKRAALAAAGVRKLLSYQRYDGGWGTWQGSRISWPFLSAYATFALLRAKEAGERVPAAKLQRAKRFLKYRLDHPRKQFGEHVAWVAQTASVWVLSEMKQLERQHMARLYGLRAKLPLFARAWLMVALHRAEGRSARVEELLREIDNAAVQTASSAHFAEGKTESLRLLMHSNDRTDAIVLSALLEVAPRHPLLAKLARGLLQARVRGRWSTTQANAYALVALARYYRQVEKTTPDHVARIWYGAGFMGQARFKGRQMKVVEQTIPLDALSRFGDRKLLLAKQGAGKLYYRIGLRYAPADLLLPAEEQGFSVSRVYEPIRDAKGKLQEQTVKRRADGSWEIRAGSTVRARVVVVVPDRRYFVAISDPLPAGLEPINLGFSTSARSRLSRRLDNRTYDSWSWYSLLAFDHRELRDDRVVLFADRLPAGVYEYTYLARATTYGSFVAAPTKAEEMYRPETFGRGATTRVVVR